MFLSKKKKEEEEERKKRKSNIATCPHFHPHKLPGLGWACLNPFTSWALVWRDPGRRERSQG